MARTWTVPLNLDAFNAAYAALDADEVGELAAFVKGLHKGLNAGRLKEVAPEAMALGFDLGQTFRQEAEVKRARSKEGGQMSAMNRAMKYGSAQPSGAGLEGASDPPRSDLEGGLSQSRNEKSINESNELPKNLHPRGGTSGHPPAKPVSLTPLRSQEAIEAFAELWSIWPPTRTADNKPAKGNRVPAERAFQAILDKGAATVEELLSAAKLYLGHHPNVKIGWVAQVSTFFGEEKALWAEGVRTIRTRHARGQGGDSPTSTADYLDALNAEVG